MEVIREIGLSGFNTAKRLLEERNLRRPEIFSSIVAAFLLILWVTGILQTLLELLIWILVIVCSVLSGLALVLCNGRHRNPPAPRQTVEQLKTSQLMERMTKNYNRHYFIRKLVIARQMDKSLQEVFDLVIRDFCLSWFRDIGRDETAFVELVNKEFWTVTENLVERLKNVDVVKFLANDVVTRLHSHFQDLSQSDARQYPGQTAPFLLHPSLKDTESELSFLRTAGEALLFCLLPKSDSQCAPMRYLLREVLAQYVFKATADSVCEPDYINQTLVMYLEDREKITETHKQQYAYAETYEDFIKLINTVNDVETLKQIRYHTIAEIMQATVIHNLKGIDIQDGTTKSRKQNKRELLRARNLKRYINQCRVAKTQCEKRIRVLGGPDYRSDSLQKAGNSSEKPVNSQVKRRRKPTAKILSFIEIMDNSLARRFFDTFLQRNHSNNLLMFWMEVEKLRMAKPDDLWLKSQDIFQTYVTPSANHVIKLDTRLVRGMEDFLYGTGGLEYFLDAQKVVYKIMEEQYYRDFVLSRDYTEYICKSESAMDQLMPHLGGQDNVEVDWSDDVNVTERYGTDGWKLNLPSNLEERNDYTVRRLQLLDQNLASKTQALELSKRALPPDPQEIETLEQEMDSLITERRHLEFHMERTDLWSELIGYWRATISNVQLNATDAKNPLFVICVSCDEAAEKIHDPGALSTGWVVVRELKDFYALHAKLKECCSWMSKEMPIPAKKRLKKFDPEVLERFRSSLEEYLTILLEDERLCQSEELYSFLSPSSEQIRQKISLGTPHEKDRNSSFISSLKGSVQNMSFPDILSAASDEADAEEIGIEESVQDRKDSIAEPLYALIGEVFELKGVFKYLRRTLISFVQVTFGGTINKQVRDAVEWLVSEPMLIYYIGNFKDSMWPSGRLAPYPAPRSTLEKLRTREKAKEKVKENIPDVLQHLLGKRNSKLGFIKIFEAFQDVKTNKHLFYVLLELVIITLCPEIKSDKTLLYIEEKRSKTKNE